MSQTNGRVHKAEPVSEGGDQVVDLVALLASRGALPSAKPSSIAARLERRFGLGDRPDLARKLYCSVEQWVEKGGDDAYRVVAEIVAQAASARRPGNYVRATLARLLRPRKKEVDW